MFVISVDREECVRPRFGFGRILIMFCGEDFSVLDNSEAELTQFVSVSKVEIHDSLVCMSLDYRSEFD